MIWRPKKFRISLKITLMVTGFLAVTFIIVTPIIIGVLTKQSKKSLVTQSRSFASLSTRPIGDAFLLYQDSGVAKLHEQIQRITESDTSIANMVIVDVSGHTLYQHRDSNVLVPEAAAASFQPIYDLDEDGYISRVTYPFIEQSGAHRYTMVYVINSGEIKATLASLQNNILLIAVAITILAGSTLVIFIEFLFVRPLKRMTQLAAAISAGDYGQSVTLTSRDEINQLGNALNTMSARLKEDIAAIKQADAMKSEFLIVSSHNLRTPLTVITGYLDLLRDAPLDPKVKKQLQTIEMYAQQLTQLTNDMLTVAELEGHDRLQVSLETIDLRDLLTNLQPAINQHLAKKEQVLQVDFGVTQIKVQVQATYLQTALWNLIDNASKFTPAKGKIAIIVHALAGEVGIAVKDSGIGISELEKAKLFTKFHRGTSVMKYEYEGIGLGLYMTKLMLEYMGASISFESQEAMGSTFTIHIPLKAAPAVTQTIVPAGHSRELKINPTNHTA